MNAQSTSPTTQIGAQTVRNIIISHVTARREASFLQLKKARETSSVLQFQGLGTRGPEKKEESYSEE
jgi:hypothetical protein